MIGIVCQLEEIRLRILRACERAERNVEDVTLVAVSKTFPVESIRLIYDAGQNEFGESRQQEAAAKIEALPSSISWHFIGRVQRNKVRKILPLFAYIHAVDSLKLARYIDEVAGEMSLRPRLFLQVNQAGEESKGGFDETSLREAMDEISGFRNVEVIGLMTIPPAVDDPEESRCWFASLRKLRDELVVNSNMKLSCLSMGMSGDFEVAIEEGATHVRVGSAIFGAREGKVDGELG